MSDTCPRELAPSPRLSRCTPRRLMEPGARRRVGLKPAPFGREEAEGHPGTGAVHAAGTSDAWAALLAPSGPTCS